MAGHNKWSKIKHKKAATDAAKSKIFGKMARMIQIAAKQCNGDVNSPTLRAAIEKARKVNMPKDNIERAIKKAGEAADASEVLYEGFGPGGCGLIITTLTDNTNRTTPEMRQIFKKNGFSLGAQGSVSWGFSRSSETGDWEPQNTMELSDEDIEKLSKLVEELEDHDDVQEVYTNVE